MKTGLPESADYYRPKRASALRRRAGTLADAANVLFSVSLLAVFLVPVIVGFVFMPHPVVLLAVMLVTLGLTYGPGALLKRAAHHHSTAADRLEAEHAARYGAALAGEEP